MEKRVILLDEHPAMVMAMKSMLQDQPLFEVVAVTTTGQECLQMIKELTPDMTILDIDIPDIDGMNLIRKIFVSCPSIKVLIFSRQNESVYGRRVKMLGAHGWVDKRAALNIILAACVAVSQGYHFFSSRGNKESEFGSNDILALLSNRELQVMKLLSEGSRNQEISALLHISSKTVATYKSRLFEKLGFSNIAQLIKFCRLNRINMRGY